VEGVRRTLDKQCKAWTLILKGCGGKNLIKRFWDREKRHVIDTTEKQRLNWGEKTVGSTA